MKGQRRQHRPEDPSYQSRAMKPSGSTGLQKTCPSRDGRGSARDRKSVSLVPRLTWRERGLRDTEDRDTEDNLDSPRCPPDGDTFLPETLRKRRRDEDVSRRF